MDPKPVFLEIGKTETYYPKNNFDVWNNLEKSFMNIFLYSWIHCVFLDTHIIIPATNHHG